MSLLVQSMLQKPLCDNQMYQFSLIEIESGHTVVDPEAGSYLTGPDDLALLWSLDSLVG